MNEADIQMMHNNRHDCPNVRKAVQLLYRLVQAVNAQSDGWAYWSAPSKSATKLTNLLKEKCGNLWYDTQGTITEAELKKAIAPIKSMVTRQNKIQAKYGNTFTFDVAS
jgi:hypothetical protein